MEICYHTDIKLGTALALNTVSDHMKRSKTETTGLPSAVRMFTGKLNVHGSNSQPNDCPMVQFQPWHLTLTRFTCNQGERQTFTSSTLIINWSSVCHALHPQQYSRTGRRTCNSHAVTGYANNMPDLVRASRSVCVWPDVFGDGTGSMINSIVLNSLVPFALRNDVTYWAATKHRNWQNV